MCSTPTAVGSARPVWRSLFLVGALAVVVVVATVCWPWLRVSHHVTSARRALWRGDAAKALRSLEVAKRISPDRADVQYLLAVANRRAGYLDRFDVYLQRASELGWPEEDIQRQEWLAVAQTGNVAAVERQLLDTIQQGASDEAAEEIYEALSIGHLGAFRVREAWRCLDHWLHWRPHSPQAHLLRAGIYERIQDLSSAADDYRAVIEQVPGHRLARIKLGQVLLLGRGGVEEAQEHFRACLAASPEDTDALVGLAQCRRRLGDIAEAHRLIEEALARQLPPRQKAAALLELGEILLSEGKATEAVGVLEKSIEIEPAEVLAHYAISRALATAGQTQQAKDHANRVQEIKEAEKRLVDITGRVMGAPYDAGLRCEAGAVLLELGRQSEAVGWLLSALACDPTHQKSHEILADYCRRTGNQSLEARLHLTKGKGLLKKGRLWQALEEFGQARHHPDTAVEAYALSGEALYKVEQFGSAIHVLSQALQRDPTQTNARRWLAAAYHDIGAMDDALRELQLVAEQAPHDPRPHRLMGLIFKDYEAYTKAIPAYRESLRRDPNQPDKHRILIELAECLMQEGRYAEALETLRGCPKSAPRLALEAKCHYAQGNRTVARKLVDDVLGSEPDHLGALQLSATLALESDDAASAVRTLQQAAKHHPKDFHVRYRLAQAYQRIGETELAKEELKVMNELRVLRRRFTDLHRKAIEEPMNADVRYELGILAGQLDKPDLARTWLVAALGMNPEHEEARKALEQMMPQTAPLTESEAEQEEALANNGTVPEATGSSKPCSGD